MSRSTVSQTHQWQSDRIKTLKEKIGSTKCEDNQWTLMLREQLCKMDHPMDSSKLELVGSTVRVGPIHMITKNKEFPGVFVCVCTTGYRKVYESKSSSWSVVMDHLFLTHYITKDVNHPTILSKQVKEARAECKNRALDTVMSEARFQAICTTCIFLYQELQSSVS